MYFVFQLNPHVTLLGSMLSTALCFQYCFSCCNQFFYTAGQGSRKQLITKYSTEHIFSIRCNQFSMRRYIFRCIAFPHVTQCLVKFIASSLVFSGGTLIYKGKCIESFVILIRWLQCHISPGTLHSWQPHQQKVIWHVCTSNLHILTCSIKSKFSTRRTSE